MSGNTAIRLWLSNEFDDQFVREAPSPIELRTGEIDARPADAAHSGDQHQPDSPQTRPSALGKSRAEVYLAVSALLLMILAMTTTALRVLAISSGATLAHIRNVPRTLSRRFPIQPAVRRAAAR